MRAEARVCDVSINAIVISKGSTTRLTLVAPEVLCYSKLLTGDRP